MASHVTTDSDDEEYVDIPPHVREIFDKGLRHVNDNEFNSRVGKVRQWLSDVGQGDVLPDDLSKASPSFLKETAQKLVDMGAVTAEWEEDVSGNIVKGSLKGNEAAMADYYRERDAKRKAKEEEEKRKQDELDDEVLEPKIYTYGCGKMELDPLAGLPRWTRKQERLFWETARNDIADQFEKLKRPSWRSFDFGTLTDEQREQLIELDNRFSQAGIQLHHPMIDSSDDATDSDDDSDVSVSSFNSSDEDAVLVDKVRNKSKKKKSTNNEPDLDDVSVGDATGSSEDDDFLCYENPPEVPDWITPENKEESIPAFVEQLKQRRERAIYEKKLRKAIAKKLQSQSTLSKEKDMKASGDAKPSTSKAKPTEKATSPRPGPSGIKKAGKPTTLSKTNSAKPTAGNITSKKPVVIKWVPPKDPKKVGVTAKVDCGQNKAKGADVNKKKLELKATCVETGKKTAAKTTEPKKCNTKMSAYNVKKSHECEDPDVKKPQMKLSIESVEIDNSTRRQKPDEWVIVTGNKEDPTKLTKHFVKAPGAKKVKKMLDNWEEIEKCYQEAGSGLEEEITAENLEQYFHKPQKSNK